MDFETKSSLSTETNESSDQDDAKDIVLEIRKL